MPSRPPSIRAAKSTTPVVGGNEQRGSASSRGYDRKWRKTRERILAVEPLCRDCIAAGKVEVATEVHHVRKVTEAPELMHDPDNLIPLCKPCHSWRTDRGE